MKARKSILLLCAFVLALLLTGSALAASETIEVDYIEAYCSYTTGDWWWEGNVYHERDSLQIGYHVKLDEADPIETGVNEIWVNLDYNTFTGLGTGSGKWYGQEADSFAGTWNAKMVNIGGYTWIITPENPGKVVGHGMGTFEGWKVKSEFYHIDPTSVPGICPDGADPIYAALHHAVYLKP